MMKKIAVFHPSSELYGADRIMVNAVKALPDFQPVIYLPSKGVLVDFIKNEIPEAEVIIQPNMPIICRAMFGLKGGLEMVTKLVKFRRFVRKENRKYSFDKIYVNTLACSFLLPALKSLKLPIITHVHEILDTPKIAAKVTAKLAFSYSNTVISVSKAVQDNLHRFAQSRKAKSIVVHNGILPVPEVELTRPKGISFYLFGRIKPEKGQWYLLEAIRLIPKNELKNVQFNLVGGTLEGRENLKTALEEKIKEYGLSGIVRLKPFTKDISLEMSKADVCLIPSLMKDPFPTTVLEAMSTGKAVVVSDTGGAKEAISHNKTGLLITSDNAELFASTLRRLIHEPDLIKSIGEMARKAFYENFTLQHFNQRWVAATNTEQL